MPVKSSSSPVFKWPDSDQVAAALRRWAERAAERTDIRRVGYFGSYARGDWGVGSDVDLLVIVRDPERPAPFEYRAAAWDLTGLPVPAELRVYTESEWEALMARADRFARTLQAETVWLVDR